MNLIPAYNSNLSTFQYLQLLALLQSDVAKGEYAAGQLFDVQAAQALEQQGTDFSNLAVPSAGQRAEAYSLNNPMALLTARYAALQSECADFTSRLGGFMSMLEKEASLIDFLIAGGGLKAWVSSCPHLSGAVEFAWDFSASPGPRDFSLPLVDPQNPGLIHPPLNAEVAVVAEQSGPFWIAGTAPGAQVTVAPPTDLAWSFASEGSSEAVYGPDWGKLSILEPAPLLTIGSPVVTQLSPVLNSAAARSAKWSDFFAVGGVSNAGNLPVFIETTFLARRTLASGVAMGGSYTPSLFRILSDDLIVYNDSQAYINGIDYSVSDAGVITAAPALQGKTVDILFTEYYPAFRCSINQGAWSPYVMLDPLRPYPDDATSFPPIVVAGNKFAVTDEMATPLGLTLIMTSKPTLANAAGGGEYLLRVDQPATDPTAANYGEIASLEIDVTPGYFNGLRLAPSTSSPMILGSLLVYGLDGIDATQALNNYPLVIDREMTIRFDRTMAKKFVLEFLQVGYALNQHQVNPADFAKRSALAQLQAAVPFAVRSIDPPYSQLVSGAQYDFGVRRIAAVDWSTNAAKGSPAILISGPWDVTGCPEVVRLDCQWTGNTWAYLEVQETYEDGTQSAVVESRITPPVCQPYARLSPTLAPVAVRFWLKFVLYEDLSAIERFLLQVACP